MEQQNIIQDDCVIEVDNITKKFKIYMDKGHTIKERVTALYRNKYEVKSVLNGVSFKINRGESVGLIGTNGCGKSTTLKILNRIMYPDSGTVKVKGRVSSLLELGAGFHPDMTGIENIYINASIFGLTKKEIDDKLQDIIDFADLGDYINNPVRTYSSGMYMRLAFAVAINVNADVLLVDEILAVGDVNFQTKCINKLMDIKKQGTTIVLVSHSTDQIEKVCERSIWIKDGLVEMEGNPRLVHAEYMKYMGMQRREALAAKSRELSPEEFEKIKYDRAGSGEIRIIKVDTETGDGRNESVFEYGEDIVFRIKYKTFKQMKGVSFGFQIVRNDGMLCYGTSMKAEGEDTLDCMRDGEFTIAFTKCHLLKGSYTVDVSVVGEDGNMIDFCPTVGDFEVYQSVRQNGVVYLEHDWKFVQ